MNNYDDIYTTNGENLWIVSRSFRDLILTTVSSQPSLIVNTVPYYTPPRPNGSSNMLANSVSLYDTLSLWAGPDSEAAALQTWVANEAVLDGFLHCHPGPPGEYD